MKSHRDPTEPERATGTPLSQKEPQGPEDIAKTEEQQKPGDANLHLSTGPGNTRQRAHSAEVAGLRLLMGCLLFMSRPASTVAILAPCTSASWLTDPLQTPEDPGWCA